MGACGFAQWVYWYICSSEWVCKSSPVSDYISIWMHCVWSCFELSFDGDGGFFISLEAKGLAWRGEEAKFPKHLQQHDLHKGTVLSFSVSGDSWQLVTAMHDKGDGLILCRWHWWGYACVFFSCWFCWNWYYSYLQSAIIGEPFLLAHWSSPLFLTYFVFEEIGGLGVIYLLTILTSHWHLIQWSCVSWHCTWYSDGWSL
jgi:hypothetical protein